MSADPSPYADPEFARRYLAASAKAEDRGAREHRRRLLAGTSGTVCEVGAGHGINFAHYPTGVVKVLAVEPEPTLRGHAVTAAQRSAVDIEVVDGSADALPVPDSSCDAVVASLVLCSVPDQHTALAEIRRVLRPGGQLHFYEHVRSGRRSVAWLQHVIAPLWGHFAGGCHPDRDTVGAVRATGFSVTDLDTFAFAPVRGVPQFAHVIGRAVVTSGSRGQSG